MQQQLELPIGQAVAEMRIPDGPGLSWPEVLAKLELCAGYTYVTSVHGHPQYQATVICVERSGDDQKSIAICVKDAKSWTPKGGWHACGARSWCQSMKELSEYTAHVDGHGVLTLTRHDADGGVLRRLAFHPPGTYLEH